MVTSASENAPALNFIVSRGPFLESPETFRMTRNIAVLLILIPFTTYQKTNFTE